MTPPQVDELKRELIELVTLAVPEHYPQFATDHLVKCIEILASQSAEVGRAEGYQEGMEFAQQCLG